MQTFLPYPDFVESARVLDWRRLGKQRVEAMQLLNVILKRLPSSGWANHPAALMWQPFPDALKFYHNVMITEWVFRGYQNTMLLELLPPPTDIKLPSWLGRADFHASHRSNLLRKDPEHYGQFGWSEPPTLPYVWPIP